MLELERKCPKCGNIYPEKGECQECDGLGVILTEDGKAAASLVLSLMDRREEVQETRARYMALAKKGER